MNSQAEADIHARLTGPVTVLMPAYNASETIDESIRSVVDQTYRNWNLLIIDDDSTDTTPEICQKWARRDPRIVPVRVEHKGFTGVLNYGLSLGQSKYIARIDADDLWKAARLEKQFSFLKENPEVKVVGTWGEQIGASGEKIQVLEHGPANLHEYFKTKQASLPIVLIHSSILADRATILESGSYVFDNYPIDDTFLWNRIAERHLVLAIPENLVSYRLSENGICASNFKLLSMQFDRLRYNLKNKTSLNRIEYESLIQSSPIKRMLFLRNYWKKYTRRTGIAHFRSKRRVSGCSYMALGFFLDPLYYFRKMWGKPPVY